MTTFSFRIRRFLNPASTNQTSYVQAVVESSRKGVYPWGTNMLTIADCKRAIELEFFVGTPRARKLAVAKLNLLIKILTMFRDALIREIALIEKTK